MRKSDILLASLALLVMSCSDPALEPTVPEGPDRSTTAVTSTSGPSVSPTTSTTDPTKPDSMWPADPPGRYAIFEGGALSVVDGTERYEISDVAEAPTAAGFVGDVLVFSAGCCDGIWAWDYGDSDAAALLVGGGNDRATLHGIASDWEQRGFFLTTGGNQPGDSEDLMFYDLGVGESRRFLEMSSRRPGLTEEEQDALVGRVVATEDLVGLLFSFGDGTWVEWYTDTGQPAESPFEGIAQGDTVLDLALAPDSDLLAVGREERLHQGITIVDVVTSDGEVRSYSVPDPQSLRHLQFDGQYLTASAHRLDPAGGADGPPGRVILDTEENHFRYSPGPPILALAESVPREQTTATSAAPPEGRSAARAQALIEPFIRFSEDPTDDIFAELPLADTVDLGLGASIQKTVDGDQLRQPDTWQLDVDLFRAYVGPFSALDTLRDLDGYETTVGEHLHCVSPPIPPPDGYETHVRISVQSRLEPQDSCLRWATVDFFVELDGAVEAITLDMYEP